MTNTMPTSSLPPQELPYFVTDGMNLVKEEVKELPYYATLNVRSEQDTLMTFVADKIPEGYRVSLID